MSKGNFVLTCRAGSTKQTSLDNNLSNVQTTVVRGVCGRALKLQSNWEGTFGKCYCCQPDSGNPTVRDERGACGNTDMENAKRVRKAETPKQPSIYLSCSAPYFYPTSSPSGAHYCKTPLPLAIVATPFGRSRLAARLSASLRAASVRLGLDFARYLCHKYRTSPFSSRAKPGTQHGSAPDRCSAALHTNR